MYSWEGHGRLAAHVTRNRGPSAAFIPGDLCPCSDFARSFEFFPRSPFSPPLLACPPLSRLASVFCIITRASCPLPLVFDLQNGPCSPLFPSCVCSSSLRSLLPVTAKAFLSPFGAICPDHFSLQYHTDEPMGSLAVNNPQERRACSYNLLFNLGVPGKRAGSCRVEAPNWLKQAKWALRSLGRKLEGTEWLCFLPTQDRWKG